MVADQRLTLGEVGDDLGAHHLAEERFLRIEVEVDGSLADAGEAGDVVDLGARESHLAEDLLCGVENFVGTGFRPALPARTGGGIRRDCWVHRRPSSN